MASKNPVFKENTDKPDPTPKKRIISGIHISTIHSKSTNLKLKHASCPKHFPFSFGYADV